MCVSQVSETRVELEIGKKTVRQTGVGEQPSNTLNRSDRSALEEALKIKNQMKDVEVVAIGLGSLNIRDHLIICLKLGADRAVHLICEESSFDSYGVAFEISRYLKHAEFDIILCGNRTSDWNGGQVGAVLGQILDLPQITEVVKIEVNPLKNTVIGHRKLKRSDRQIVECSLPAVITVDPMINQPRYISVHTQVKKHPFEAISLEQVTVSPQQVQNNAMTELVGVGVRRPRPKKMIMPDKNLSAEDRLKFILSGGQNATKKGNILTGAVEEVAQKIILFLTQEKVS